MKDHLAYTTDPGFPHTQATGTAVSAESKTSTPTPRTDAEWSILLKAMDGYEVSAACAAALHKFYTHTRQLETELSEANSIRQLMRKSHEDSLESDSIVASCDCLTKTNEVKYHKPGCKYRLISERDSLKAENEQLQNVCDLAMQPCYAKHNHLYPQVPYSASCPRCKLWSDYNQLPHVIKSKASTEHQPTKAGCSCCGKDLEQNGC